MNVVTEKVMVGQTEVSIETGRMAKQAGGSVVIRVGDTMVLVTATASSRPRDLDFMPLTCDYIEKTSAAGKIPGGFFKREGRLSEHEILTCRLMDRPLRPLFPKGWKYETQLIATVLCVDKENPSDILAVTGASAALMLSDIRFEGPIAAIRVARVGGEFIANPTYAQLDGSELNLVVACSRDAITMVEGSVSELSEDIIIDALFFGHKAAQGLLDLQEKIQAAVGKEKRAFTVPVTDQALEDQIKTFAAAKVKEAMAITAKQARYAALDDVKDAVKEEYCSEGKSYVGRDDEVSAAFGALKKEHARMMTIETGKRIDGRAHDEIRNITSEVLVLPRTHGSALFTRGETQALVTTTLGTKRDMQRIDSLVGDVQKSFMLHYNFPPFSTGETKFLRGASRREIGHGNLAERALAQVLPSQEEFPYTIRIVSEVLESNGSSSMASVCGGALSMMDAGVPLKAAVAGIAMGLMKEGDKLAILSDILGDEDHLGDMDFKVTGTEKGVTALQMDIKISGLTREILDAALKQARAGRLHILAKMKEALDGPREKMSAYAPRIVTIKINPDKIRDIIGPGGKTIRAITEETGVSIDVEDDGTVNIAASDDRASQKAQDIIKGLTMEAEPGAFYQGVVKKIVEFGAFVEIMPGTDGLLHISEIDKKRVNRVEDFLKEGDHVLVKCLAVDRQGKIKLSRKEALGETPDEIHNFVS